MAKIIALFNHKGGVSKTTTTFNIGWMLAKEGKKVLMVDSDPQCNLTQTVVGVDESEKFYENSYGRSNNIYKLIEPSLLKSSGVKNIPELELLKHNDNENLFLLAGSEDIDEVEVSLGMALKTSEKMTMFSSFPSVFNYALRELARKNRIDVILIDMSPSKSALNQCLLLSSDYFIVPTAPDFYSYRAICSLTKFLPKWNQEMNIFRNSTGELSFNENSPQFLGIISQRYRPRKEYSTSKKDTAKAFQEWIDKINNKVVTDLKVVLEKEKMCITSDDFQKIFPNAKPYNIASIPEFNTLIARSQKYAIPVYELKENELLTFGKAEAIQLESITKFKNIFQEVVNGLVKII
jgi:cellulose biosynthesis protein BcsQ